MLPVAASPTNARATAPALPTTCDREGVSSTLRWVSGYRTLGDDAVEVRKVWQQLPALTPTCRPHGGWPDRFALGGSRWGQRDEWPSRTDGTDQDDDGRPEGDAPTPRQPRRHPLPNPVDGLGAGHHGVCQSSDREPDDVGHQSQRPDPPASCLGSSGPPDGVGEASSRRQDYRSRHHRNPVSDLEGVDGAVDGEPRQERVHPQGT